MRSFAIAALVGSATAVQFGANDVPTCKVVNGHTVVSYTANIHPSFKCSHTGGSCKCTVHPTHAQGKCREFDHSDGVNHKVSGDCTASGVNAINGGWSSFTAWSACSKTCATGTQSRTRLCNSPFPNVNGAACVGQGTESQNCNTQACPPKFTAGTKITDCGKTHGHSGPTQAQCNSAYSGTNNNFLKSVSVSNGIQKFVVPGTGSYRIKAVAPGGAQQENNEVHGRGATVYGTVSLTQGETLWILVGQQSDYYKASSNEQQWIGGSGGTFVAKGSSLGSSTPLVVAGGAGGHRSRKTTANALMNGACTTDAKDGSKVGGGDTTSGSNNGLTSGFGYGGKGGYGGQNGRATSGSHTPGGGAGFYGDAEASTDTRRGATVRAYSFRNGGKGGIFGIGYNSYPIDGGFGGGGSGAWGGTGGGGGYSGGGGDPNTGHSGGGGSYSVSGFGGCTSTNQGVGYVEISLA